MTLDVNVDAPWNAECGMRNAGYGLVCHRVLRELCTLLGIRDIYAKVEGSTRNYRTVIGAFLRLLYLQVLLFSFSHFLPPAFLHHSLLFFTLSLHSIYHFSFSTILTSISFSFLRKTQSTLFLFGFPRF